LRDAGFSDADIWDIAAVTSFFNMSNRMSGGLPIVEKGEFLEAVGASGDTIEEDIACCVEALRACGFTTEFADPLKAKK